MAQSDLDLVRREEAARAGMHPVAEAKSLGARAHELRLVLLPGHLAHAQIAVAVEHVGVLVDSRVIPGAIHNHTLGPLGNDGSIRQSNISLSDTSQRSCERAIVLALF